MKLHPLLLLLSLWIPLVNAGESILIGKARSGKVFEFRDTILPLTEQERSSGEVVEHRFDLVLKKDAIGYFQDPKSKKWKRTRHVEQEPVSELILAPCARQIKSGELVCGPNAPFGLANARYRHDRQLGVDGGFRCIRSCSDQVPRTLKFEGIESGC